MFYSKSTNGFYIEEIHGNDIPNDAVEITKEYHKQLLHDNGQGKIITSDTNGYPIVIDPPARTANELIEEIKNSRQSAYSKESDPIMAKMLRGEATQQEWLDKIQEIKARFPLPQ